MKTHVPGLLLRALCFAILLVASYPLSAQNDLAADLAQRRVEHLRRGINTSHWFSQAGPQGYTKERLQAANTAEDFALIKALGFDHVRFSLDPQPMFTVNRPDEIPVEYLGYVDAALKLVLDHGLAVVIDIHPQSDFKARLAKDDEFVQQFADFWRALARHYASWDPDRVFFEIINEPEFNDRYRWYGVEAKVAAAIREGDPQHTIIATGAHWSDDDDLVFLEPLRDANVIYNFHFYEPHIFTHQGATWGSYYWHWVKGLRYPSSPESAAQTAANVPEAIDRLRVIRYGQDHWDAARIEADINQAAEWAHRYDVPLVCNEFGAYRPYSNPQDRAAWIHDVRTALEKDGIGWAMWDYSDSFGVVTKTNGHPVPDELTVHALGLEMPGAR